MFQRNSGESGTKSSTTIAFVHHKGGTGKTTSCLNIAGWLAKMDQKVLVVDLDPQGNATAGLGIDRESCEGTIYDVFFGEHEIEDVILETESGVYLAPSSIDLLAAETHMAGQANTAGILKKKLSSVEKHFDYILTDVLPGISLLLITGIVASSNIVIPLDSGIFGYETMATLKQLLIDLNEELGVEANIMMVLLREWPAVSLFSRGPTKEIKKMLKEFLEVNNIPEVKIFTIPFSRKIYKAQMKGLPISHYTPFSNVGRVYKRIAKEIIAGKE